MWTIRLHRRQFLTHRQTQASSQSFPQSGCTRSLPPSPASDLLTNPILPSPSLSSFCSCRKVDTAQLTHSQSIYLISSTHQVLITAGTGCSSGPPQMRAEFSMSMLGRLTSQPGEWSVTLEPPAAFSVCPLHIIRSLRFGSHDLDTNEEQGIEIFRMLASHDDSDS